MNCPRLSIGLLGLAALLCASAGLCPVVAQEQRAQGKQQANDDADSARELIQSLRLVKAGFADPDHPTEAELQQYHDVAWDLIADYLEEHPSAVDYDLLYHFAARRSEWAFGAEGFILLAERYLNENPTARDADEWRRNLLFASLGSKPRRDDALASLAEMEKEAGQDLSAVLDVRDVTLRAAVAAADDGEARKLRKQLLDDKRFAGTDDDALYRKLMRVILANAPATIEVGKPFPDWGEIMPVRDLDGKTVCAADYKGKVLLIDFWATWCGVSMRAMPDLIKLYSARHEEGFEIIGVTLDRENSEERLKKTIAGDGKVAAMPWRQVFDGGYVDAGLVRRHRLRDLPTNILVDRKGVVVAMGLRGEELEKKVVELLAQKPD